MQNLCKELKTRKKRRLWTVTVLLVLTCQCYKHVHKLVSIFCVYSYTKIQKWTVLSCIVWYLAEFNREDRTSANHRREILTGTLKMCCYCITGTTCKTLKKVHWGELSRDSQAKLVCCSVALDASSSKLLVISQTRTTECFIITC